MSDESSDELRRGIALGFAAALALVAVVWRLRGGEDDLPYAPGDLDDEELLLGIRDQFDYLDQYMTELYDRVGLEHGLDDDLESAIDFEPMSSSEVDLDVDEELEDIDLDDEELGL